MHSCMIFSVSIRFLYSCPTNWMFPRARHRPCSHKNNVTRDGLEGKTLASKIILALSSSNQNSFVAYVTMEVPDCRWG